MSLTILRQYVVGHWRGLAVAFAAGAATIGALAGAAGLVTVFFGLYNTTATAPHNRVIAWALHTTFIHSVERRSAGIVAPAAFTPAQVLAGFRQYQVDCAMCHGGPGLARAPFVRQLVPTPPYVIDSARRFTRGQLYFILQRGVKMSAMPAWGETRSPAELWNYVAFLEALPTISPAEYAWMSRAGQKPSS